MKKILITGFSGFVAHHFLQYMYDNDVQWDVYGVDISAPSYDYQQYDKKLNIEFANLDLLDKDGVYACISRIRPDYVLHLASFSSVAYSWKKPCESFANNTNIFLNIVQAIHELEIPCRILSVGSSEEYGDVDESQLPLVEDMPLQPVSPYAVARVSQEMLSKVFVDSMGLDIVLTRSFNHIGPWQDSRFVVPGFVSRIKAIADSGAKEGTIETGDLSIVRDFVDVRDVVDAYYKLLMNGRKGEIYNICSGKGIALSEIVKMIANEFGIAIHTQINPEYVRPNDNRVVIGSRDKITQTMSWNPMHELSQTIRDII